MVRFSKFLCLVKACENCHWFLFHNQLPIVYRLAARRRWSDEGLSRQIFLAKNPKFQFFSYRHVMYLKRTHFSWRIQIDKEKIGFGWRNWEKIHFSNFCLKNEGDQVSSRVHFAKLYHQISKITLSGSGRSFNLKSLQRRALYLCSLGIGRRSPERWAIVAPRPGYWNSPDSNGFFTLLSASPDSVL